MNINRKVPIQNILYMFSYTWDKIQYIDFDYKDNNDDFDSANILAKLFLENIKDILKIGLYKEYNKHTQEIRGIKGKIDFMQSIYNTSFQNAKAVCTYDTLEENNLINQIIKTTAYQLYKTDEIKLSYKRKLNEILFHFGDIDMINLTEQTFQIPFHENNLYTYYIIMVCELINSCTMLSEETGTYKFIDILDDDEKMTRIFELFIYRFYSKEQKNYHVSRQKTLNWNIQSNSQSGLPKMRLDTYLYNKENAIIIDTKYYKDFTKNTTTNFYQMFTYMNQLNPNKNLRGILLYPMPYNQNKISEKHPIDIMDNGTIQKSTLEIHTIDLSKNWREIKTELLKLL